MAAMISTGEDKENANIDTDALRLELKTWEKEFVLAHGGRKPGREDIKKDPAIGMSGTWPSHRYLHSMEWLNVVTCRSEI